MKTKKFTAIRHALWSIAWHLKARLYRLPMLGDIDEKPRVPAAKIRSRVFGSSNGLSLAVEIKVRNENGMPENIGRVVKKELFSTPEYNGKDLIFNVCFSCGKSGLFTKGLYTDPKSHWFNVFFGYYEIDVPVRTWQRPFGYDLSGAVPSVKFGDLARIGIADWNYFSNYLYGVPMKAIIGCSDPDDPNIKTRSIGRIEIKNGSWDHVEVDNFSVVSSYTAPGEEHLLEERSIFAPMWRLSYGMPHPREEFRKSFFPCRMKAQFYMAYDRIDRDKDLGEPAYRTFIFGGTVNHDAAIDEKKFTGSGKTGAGLADKDSFNDAFLGEQMKAVRRVIEKEFSHRGFRS